VEKSIADLEIASKEAVEFSVTDFNGLIYKRCEPQVRQTKMAFDKP
jgi:hypothetical protein